MYVYIYIYIHIYIYIYIYICGRDFWVYIARALIHNYIARFRIHTLMAHMCARLQPVFAHRFWQLFGRRPMTTQLLARERRGTIFPWKFWLGCSTQLGHRNARLQRVFAHWFCQVSGTRPMTIQWLAMERRGGALSSMKVFVGFRNTLMAHKRAIVASLCTPALSTLWSWLIHVDEGKRLVKIQVLAKDRRNTIFHESFSRRTKA